MKNIMNVTKDLSVIYYVVYGETTENRYFAEQFANYLAEKCEISVRACNDTEMHDNEILIGNTSRQVSIDVGNTLSDGDFVAGMFDGCYVIQSNNGLGFTFGGLHLIQTIRACSKNGCVTIGEAQNTRGNFNLMPRDERFAEIVALANKLSGTSSRFGDAYFADPNSTATPEMRADHALVMALRKRMGGSLALLEGSSSALLNGFVVKQDKNDYSRVTRVVNGHVFVVAEFAAEYFGSDVSANADGYADITAYCDGTDAYSLFYDPSAKLAVVTPADVAPFDQLETEVDGYTNLQYLTRMLRFFNNPKMPEPNNNVEQSRCVVAATPPEAEAKYFYNYVWHETDEGAEVVYSPAVYTRTENDVRVIYAAYEYSVKGKKINLHTYLRRSADDGKTWETVAVVDRVAFASITEVQGKLYLIGNYASDEEPLFYVAEYDPIKKGLRESILSSQIGGGAPNTVLHANGRIFKAYNNAVASAEIGSDLLKEESWTFSNNPKTFFTRELYERIVGVKTRPYFGIEEGNVVQAPDGKLWVMYRINASPSMGYVAIYRLSDDGKTLTVGDESEYISKFPYTQSKFSLIYDEKLKMYIALSSLSTQNHTGQRNVLGLVVAKDLWNWEIVDILLIDREMLDDRYSLLQHAYQYVDFVTEGDDLYFMVREASGDCYWYHENNYITMYKIENYVEFIQTRLENKYGKGEKK